MRLVLASGSPRRRELLAQAGYRFEVRVADVDESVREGEAPREYVERLAREKAQTVVSLDPGAVVLGADTTVVVDGVVLGKPVDAVDAARMLRLLSGRTHEVMTGIAVARGAEARSHVETTAVVFREIAEEELRAYVASGDAMDKA
jgi:septum formation protein